MTSETSEHFEPMMADERIREATGKGREEWFAILDAVDAHTFAHRDIAHLLVTEHGVPGWWAQTVTVEYERARGLRDKHQTAEGYAVSKSKTVRAPIEAVHRAWSDEVWRQVWLPEPFEITSAKAPRTVNGRWGDGGHVTVRLTAKGEGRTQVSVGHEKLPDADAAEREKLAWGDRLTQLAEAVERR